MPWYKIYFLVPNVGKEISWQYSTYKTVMLMMQKVLVLIEMENSIQFQFQLLLWNLDPRRLYLPTPGCPWAPAWLPLWIQTQICLYVCLDLFIAASEHSSCPLFISVPSVLPSPLWDMVSGFSCVSEIPVVINRSLLAHSVCNHWPHYKWPPSKRGPRPRQTQVAQFLPVQISDVLPLIVPWPQYSCAQLYTQQSDTLLR